MVSQLTNRPIVTLILLPKLGWLKHLVKFLMKIFLWFLVICQVYRIGKELPLLLKFSDDLFAYKLSAFVIAVDSLWAAYRPAIDQGRVIVCLEDLVEFESHPPRHWRISLLTQEYNAQLWAICRLGIFEGKLVGFDELPNAFKRTCFRIFAGISVDEQLNCFVFFNSLCHRLKCVQCRFWLRLISGAKLDLPDALERFIIEFVFPEQFGLAKLVHCEPPLPPLADVVRDPEDRLCQTLRQLLPKQTGGDQTQRTADRLQFTHRNGRVLGQASNLDAKLMAQRLAAVLGLRDAVRCQLAFSLAKRAALVAPDHGLE